jgi:uncharacterized membrane protein
MYSRIKIFGHPIHPMLIAYPIAFYTSTLIGFIVYAATNDLFWLKLAIAVNLAGIVMAAVAALPGFIDWLVGIPRQTEAKRDGMIHGLLNVTALGLFVASFASYAGHWNGPNTGAGLGIVLSALGVLCTLGAGWFGWTLVQTWHVGVQLEREQAAADPTLRDARTRKAS